MAKMRVAVLFGGVSSEHEVSCLSAASVVDNMSAESYDVLKIGITKKGRWLLYPGGTDKMRDGSWDTFPDCVPAIISPDRTTRGLIISHEGGFDVMKLDMVFPVLHGRNGEDGTIQGLLDLAGIPYVGCGVLASAMCMDKATANQVFDTMGIPHTPWLALDRDEMADVEEILQRMEGKISFPIFVKPSIGGSSVGVTKVKQPEDLPAALQLAAAHGRKIVLEQAVSGKELECSVLGNTAPFVSRPGEVESCNETYDYEAKYLSGDASRLYLPARIPAEKQEEVCTLALQAYKALGCAGLARVDFFVEEATGRVFINEVNTMPGFTNISMYSKLMDMSGTPFPELIDQLIMLACERAEV